MQQDLEQYRDAPPSTVAIGAVALAYHAETFGPFGLAWDTVRGALYEIGYALVNMKVTAITASVTVMHRASGVVLNARVDIVARGLT